MFSLSVMFSCWDVKGTTCIAANSKHFVGWSAQADLGALVRLTLLEAPLGAAAALPASLGSLVELRVRELGGQPPMGQVHLAPEP